MNDYEQDTRSVRYGGGVMSSTNTERRFLDWLAARAAGVEWKYGRWLETHRGGFSEFSYCEECAEIQRHVERHKKTGFSNISGWDDWPASDSPMRCDRCGALLYHSATECMLKAEVQEGLAGDKMLPEDAAILHHAMTCGGEYEGDREKWWPLIEPHARRLMEAVNT